MPQETHKPLASTIIEELMEKPMNLLLFLIIIAQIWRNP